MKKIDIFFEMNRKVCYSSFTEKIKGIKNYSELKSDLINTEQVFD
jgi:hypothetical protein